MKLQLNNNYYCAKVHRDRALTTICSLGSFLYKKSNKGGASMKPCKDNRYATNKGGIIKAPKPVTDSPKSTVVKGSDLRNGK